MTAICRDPDQAAPERFDLIIVGGGIYGAMLMLEATRARLRPLLLEQADFGGGVSFNNLRIVHGGLRYLQSLNLARSRDSIAERRWFLRTFPEFVRPLPCLMPLHGGLKRNPRLLKAALRFNDWLCRNSNADLAPSHRLPQGRLLGAEETRRRFPRVRREGLRAGALWYDAAMPDCHRVQIECLRWSVAAGGVALNYVEATDLVCCHDRVSGVVAVDRVAGRQHEFRADFVINAAGPACRALAARFDVDRPELFHPSLAWNLLLDRPPLVDGAVVLQPPRPGSRAYFAHSVQGRLFVGTGHEAAVEGQACGPDQGQVADMLGDLNSAVPGLDLRSDEIVAIFSGQLPATSAGTAELSVKPVVLDHRRHGGPRGLFSVSGVKYTTARSTAASIIRQLLPPGSSAADPPARGLPERPASSPYELHPDDCPDRGERVGRARSLIESEAPQTLPDLLLRRSNLAFDPAAARSVADDCCAAFGWDGARKAEQIDRLNNELDQAARAIRPDPSVWRESKEP